MTVQSYQINRFIRKTLYSLKRRYGSTVSIYKLVDASTDLRTGVKSITKSMITVLRAVVLPVKVQREVIQSISQVSANKEFVVGGSFDSGSRIFVIDARDLPADYEFHLDDWLVYDDRRYNIKNISDFEQHAAYIITGKEVIGVIPEQIIKVGAESTLAIEGVA